MNVNTESSTRRFYFKDKQHFANTKLALYLLETEDYEKLDKMSNYNYLIYDYKDEIKHCDEIYFILELKEKWETQDASFMMGDMLELMWFAVLSGNCTWETYQKFIEYFKTSMYKTFDENMFNFIKVLLNVGYAEQSEF